MHRFREAEDIARQLTAQREFVLDFGLLGDALMEQGRTREAAEAYQKMIDLKPFYQSYTRAAHLRWLRGDLDGAIQLMDLAVKSASPRDRESVAWAYTRLAIYELQRGSLAAARRLSDSALQFVPDYAAARLVQGRVLLAGRRHAEAAAVLEEAARRNPLPEYQWTLADALRGAGRESDARNIEAALMARGEIDDPRTLALFLSTRRLDPARAVALAERELDRRSDVFTLDAFAWALASAGSYDEASAFMARALEEGTEDARLFVHAAVIAAAQGRAAEAARWTRRARALRYTLLPSELERLEHPLVQPPA
jgi:tetratricopeptide (TPR) repeat protein